uniref:Domain of unknown function DB domain-containing protein n=1 Tax=Romanomermis culicivorax TaxID=13658 RepID=A0A915KVF8_ROMCU
MITLFDHSMVVEIGSLITSKAAFAERSTATSIIRKWITQEGKCTASFALGVLTARDIDADQRQRKVSTLCKNKNDYKNPSVKTAEANKDFLDCCKENLPEQCWDACAYDLKLLPTAKRVFLDGDKKNDIPKCDVVQNFVTYLRCANGGLDDEPTDNRQCCKDLGVNKVCYPFCNPTKDMQLRKEQKSCGGKLRDILACHQYGLGDEEDE